MSYRTLNRWAASGHLVPVERRRRTAGGSQSASCDFDFEERRLGNVEDLPMHWGKILAHGFPHYVNGRLAPIRRAVADTASVSIWTVAAWLSL